MRIDAVCAIALNVCFLLGCRESAKDKDIEAKVVNNLTTDSLALIALMNEYPTLAQIWKVSKPIDTWEGVGVKNGRVSSLRIRMYNPQPIPFPVSITDLTDLTKLDLFMQQINTIPPEIKKLTKLCTLDLKDNHIQTLPPEFWTLKQLAWLDLSENSWKGYKLQIPAEIKKLKKLSYLNLSKTELTKHNEIFNLTELTCLKFSNSNLWEIPAEIGNLAKLVYLDLSWSIYIHKLPAEIGKLVNLTHMDIQATNIFCLPPEIGKLSNLTYLDLSGIRNEVIPPEIGLLKNLRCLDVACGTVPAEIGNLTNLESLSLGNGNVYTCVPVVPAQIGNLKKLQKLIIFACDTMTRLSNEISNLKNLSYLKIVGMDLSNVKSGFEKIAQLSNLDSLYLVKCNMHVLPSVIGKLVSLEELDIQQNHLKTLPSDMGRLVMLKGLNLYGNNLKCLPTEIGELQNLEQLNLRKNDLLLSLPVEILKLHDLKLLQPPSSLIKNINNLPHDIAEWMQKVVDEGDFLE